MKIGIKLKILSNLLSQIYNLKFLFKLKLIIKLIFPKWFKKEIKVNKVYLLIDFLMIQISLKIKNKNLNDQINSIKLILKKVFVKKMEKRICHKNLKLLKVVN